MVLSVLRPLRRNADMFNQIVQTVPYGPISGRIHWTQQIRVLVDQVAG